MSARRRVLCREIASRSEEVEGLCGEIRALLEACDLPHACFRVELLARECLENAIVHGHGGDGSKKVRLTLSVGRRWIRLDVLDQGPGFDWRQARQKPLAETTASAGRGLYIGALYARRMAFNREGNHITLWLTKKNETGADHGRLHD